MNEIGTAPGPPPECRRCTMKLGFIGTGNMGGSILRGYVKANGPEGVYGADANPDTLAKVVADTGITPTDNKGVVDNCDTVLFAVKPIFFGKMFESIKDSVRKDQLFISIVASTSIAELEEYLGKDARIVRVMPNTPAMVGEGMASLSPNANATEEDVEKAKAIFNACGKCEVMEERLIPAVTALSGSSPAYVFMFIEALADAGVQAGMFREPAYKFAAQAVKGSAEMVLETGLHPGILKDMVCSPGGITIEAVRILEQQGMRSAVFNAALAVAGYDAQK